MSKVKINSVEFDEIRTNCQHALECIDKTKLAWGDEFEDLYYAFIDSGFLNDLYEDAKSNYYELQRASTALVCAVSVALGIVTGGIGGIIGIVLGFFGIVSVCKSEPKWITTSKEVFEQLLTDCVNGNTECYKRIINTETKVTNVIISLEEIRSKINEFNHKYASLEDSMEKFDLTGTMTDDGVLLSVDTEVTIDGKVVSTSVSEALNAFYTYTNTVMSGRMEAQLLADMYGIEIDYDALVKKGNGFVANSLDSGLYSHEFVNHILPSYNPNISDATKEAAGNLGISVSDFESLLSKAGMAIGGIGAGLIGASYLGKLNIGGKPTPPDKQNPDPNPNPNDDTTYPSGGTTYPTGGGEDNTDKTFKNEVEIEEVSKVELPEKVESEVTKDYDDLARREYEALGEEEISERRLEIMKEVEEAFASGDYTAIKEKLKELGYSDPEIDAICADRDKLMLALIEGDQRAFMAEKALELAKADGVENFDTMYDDGQKYSDLVDGTSNVLLANMSMDKKVTEVYNALVDSEKAYTESVAVAATAVEAALLSKNALTELQAKFTKEFGTEDTTKWSEEAATEYSKAVKDYNEKAKDAEEKLKAKDEAKAKYDEAKEDYKEAKEDFAERIKKGLNGEDTENDDSTENNDDKTNDDSDNGSDDSDNSNDNNDNNSDKNNDDNSVDNGINEAYPENGGPGIGIDMIPEDNALYATENMGQDGTYTEVTPGSGVSIESYKHNDSSKIAGTTTSNGSDGSVTVNISDSQLEGVVNQPTTGDITTPGVETPEEVKGMDTVTYGGPVQGEVTTANNGNKIVTISDEELLAALSIAQSEAKEDK